MFKTMKYCAPLHISLGILLLVNNTDIDCFDYIGVSENFLVDYVIQILIAKE